MSLELIHVPREPVVSEHAAIPLEGMGVLQSHATCSCVADVGDEPRRGFTLRFEREELVFVSGRRPLVDVGFPITLVGAKAVSVGIPQALNGQRIGGLQQPEGRVDPFPTRAEAEETTHVAFTLGRWRPKLIIHIEEPFPGKGNL